MNWQPIETAPENTWILTYADWADNPQIAICNFVIRNEIEQRVESESTNAKGTRKIIQEITVKKREWYGPHWEPTHWMPLPEPPK